MERMDEAQHTATELREKEPDFTLDKFAQTQPYKNAKTLDLLINRLNSAGLS
jgi:hypothetical protein